MKLSACLLAATLAVAATAAPVQAGFTLEAHGAWNLHAMGAMNDSLRSLNAAIGTDLGPIRGGPGWGIALRSWGGDVLVRLEFEKLSAATQDPVAHVSLGALAYSVSSTWFRPASGGLRSGLGLGFGLYRCWGELAGLEASGYGYGGRVAAEAMLPLGSEGLLHGMLGYRLARVSNIKLAENETELDVDYSGPFLRIGIALERRPSEQAEWR